jgi:hypothetical protein
MSLDNPQPGKRGTKTGNRSGSDRTTTGGLDPAVPSSHTDALNSSAASSQGYGATEFGTTTGAPNYETTTDQVPGQQGSGILNQVRDKAASQLNEQKARATQSLGSVAQAVRQSTHQLREQQHDTVAQFVERAADQIERFSNHLRDRDLNELVGEAQRFARQQPAVFIGSSFAAGLLAARFIKASRPTESFSDRRYSSYGTESSFDPGTSYDSAYGSGSSFGTGRAYGGGTSTDWTSSFNTSTRPGDETGRGDL